MFCLRSFATLLLLPMPWTPPVWNLLFIVAFYLSKRPCIYCTLLLIGIHASTCYWNLAPASTSTPLLSGMVQTYLPEAISACWCDFNGGALLQPRTIQLVNATTSHSQAIQSLPLQASMLADTLPIRWLSSVVDRISTGFTESKLGIKLTL